MIRMGCESFTQASVRPDIHRGRILIVDDESSSAALLADILASINLKNVVICVDPHEAVTQFAREEFDLVLLDLIMPGMNGFGVLNAFASRRDLREIPVIVVTSLDDRATCIRVLQGGAADFIAKPVHEDEVLARCVHLLESRILKKELRRQVEIRSRELRQAQMDILLHLGLAAEYRDNETGQHVQRIARMSERMAVELGCDSRFTESIRHAAHMHDIGKIGIPDSILLKPGKLTDSQWIIMKTHSTIGAAILSGGSTEHVTMAEVIAKSHHEKWDGSGYPDGLVGLEIPLEARIVAVVDVFDALTSERPYKSAWTQEAALDFILGQSGKHFDPAIVTVFLAIFPSLCTICRNHADESFKISEK